METESVKSSETAFNSHTLCVDIAKTENSKLLLLI